MRILHKSKVFSFIFEDAHHVSVVCSVLSIQSQKSHDHLVPPGFRPWHLVLLIQHFRCPANVLLVWELQIRQNQAHFLTVFPFKLFSEGKGELIETEGELLIGEDILHVEVVHRLVLAVLDESVVLFGIVLKFVLSLIFSDDVLDHLLL